MQNLEKYMLIVRENGIFRDIVIFDRKIHKIFLYSELGTPHLFWDKFWMHRRFVTSRNSIVFFSIEFVQILSLNVKWLKKYLNNILIFPPGCTQLTSSGLSNLIQLRQLEELELTNCPGSSKELIGYLRDNLSSTLVVEWTFPRRRKAVPNVE